MAELLDEEIIHIYMMDKCSHHCALCCNKQYDTMKIPVVSVEELQKAKMVCLTGGEPFLLDNVCDFAEQIKRQYPNIEQVFVYTCGDSLYDWLERGNKIHSIDGVNICPKNSYDAECVTNLFKNKDYRNQIVGLWSNRIYVFPNMSSWSHTLDFNEWNGWAYKSKYESINIIEREWQKEFKADSGIFRRLPVLFG